MAEMDQALVSLELSCHNTLCAVLGLHQKPQIELTVQYWVFQCRLHTSLTTQHTVDVKKFVCSPKFKCAAFCVPFAPGVGSNAETDVHVVLDRTTFRRTRTLGASSRTYMFSIPVPPAAAMLLVLVPGDCVMQACWPLCLSETTPGVSCIYIPLCRVCTNQQQSDTALPAGRQLRQTCRSHTS